MTTPTYTPAAGDVLRLGDYEFRVYYVGNGVCFHSYIDGRWEGSHQFTHEKFAEIAAGFDLVPVVVKPVCVPALEGGAE